MPFKEEHCLSAYIYEALVLYVIMRISPLQVDKCFVFAYNNAPYSRCRACFTAGFWLLILVSRASISDSSAGGNPCTGGQGVLSCEDLC